MTSFHGKLVLITGASSGIGAQTARDFAAKGARLILVARREDRLRALAAEITATGGQAEVRPCDLSDLYSRDRLISDLHTRNLIPDILINNAGYGNSRPFLQETPEDIYRMTTVNYLAAAHLMSYLLPQMIARGSGAMVNVASSAGRVAVPNMAVYCATKFALCALTESVGYELQGTGVTMHLINPSSTDTEFFSAGVWQGHSPWKMVTAAQVSQAIIHAVTANQAVTYIPKMRGFMVYVFNLLGPLGRWVLATRSAEK
jgi:uncharacterized protein